MKLNDQFQKPTHKTIHLSFINMFSKVIKKILEKLLSFDDVC